MIDDFLDALYSWFLSIVVSILDFFADFFLALPAPDFLTHVSASFTGLMGYLVDYFQLPYLFTAVMSAYAIRFIIRRIPFFG